jgi:hypothetical protein
MWTGMIWLRIGTGGERALVNSIMNLWVPKNAGKLRVAAQLVAPRVVLSLIELVYIHFKQPSISCRIKKRVSIELVNSVMISIFTPQLII